MYNLTIVSGETAHSVQSISGQLLSDLLRQVVTDFALPCGGNHTCGKCRVHVAGAAEPPTESERQLLSPNELAAGIRLACSCRVAGDITVTLTKEGASNIIAWNKIPKFECTEAGYGFAVDIGTTTVAMQLFDRSTGCVLAERLSKNAQRGYGADVISRIESCNTGGLDALSFRINDQLEQMAAECLIQAKIQAVDESVVTGNATMLHLYEGLDPASLAVAPFNMQSYFGCRSRRTLAGSLVYLPRCVGAYVGADIVCAILAADLMDGGVQVLTDIGTNGEMALAQDGHLLCCATAAGPAFEGAGLSCGMPAVPGAIRAVWLQNRKICYETIQGIPAKGICGSGVLDALATMLDIGALDDTGYLEEDFQIGDSGMTITQRDVRQIQLAKSAICAGLITVMEEKGISADLVDRFSVAGGFGTSINFQSACAIGLFPAALRKKTAFIGNGALGGASMLLMNKSLREKTFQFASEAVELSLSASSTFMDYYVDCMSFMEF